MVKNRQDCDLVLGVESVSAVFAHDISTPLTTAQLNAALLNEHLHLISLNFDSEEAKKLPAHIQLALERAPQLIKQNLEIIQRSLSDYKDYLNALQDNPQPPTSKINSEVVKFGFEGRLNVLLVDDEEIHHDIGEAVLKSHHDVQHENSGVSALDRCQKENFHVILMDMQMPGLPGPQTVEQLRQFIPRTTMILGLSSMPIESKKSALMECGFNGFLDKPLKLEAFNKLIETLVSNPE